MITSIAAGILLATAALYALKRKLVPARSAQKRGR